MWFDKALMIFNRSPEPVEGRLKELRLAEKRASTGSALRFMLLACPFIFLGLGYNIFTGQPATAQDWQCKAPATLPRPTIEPQEEIRRTPVSGYTLALSWSREFCRGREKDPAMALQCGGKIGDFGFIVHGLWPNAAGPDYPIWCRKARLLSRKVVADHICMSPIVQLLQHQWAKHGSCMVRRPETYFGAAKLLFEAIEFPDMDRLSRQGEKDDVPLNAAGLADAFATDNDGLPANAVRFKSNERGWLQEVRICLDKKFKPTACPRHISGARDKAEIKIWRGSGAITHIIRRKVCRSTWSQNAITRLPNCPPNYVR